MSVTRTRTLLAAGAAAAVALALAGCSGTTTETTTAYQTVAGPTVTVTTTVTVTQTQTVTASPSTTAGTVLLKQSGSGNWNSPAFQVGTTSPELQVIYSFSGNDLGGQASNFIADVESSDDDQNVANTIASSGGNTTDIYPNTSSGDTTYHLSVEADGSWSFTITELS
jgi:hypothetical protein